MIASEPLMPFVARTDENLCTPVPCNLNRNMRGGTKPVEPQRRSWAYFCLPKAPESDDLSAEQRRRFQVAEPIGQHLDELGGSGNKLRKAAVLRVSGEVRLFTQIRFPLTAIAALTAGLV